MPKQESTDCTDFLKIKKNLCNLFLIREIRGLLFAYCLFAYIQKKSRKPLYLRKVFVIIFALSPPVGGLDKEQIMPKQKTNKSVVKRVKVTGSGKVTRRSPGAGHLKSRKSPKRLRRFRSEKAVDSTFAKHAKRMMGM